MGIRLKSQTQTSVQSPCGLNEADRKSHRVAVLFLPETGPSRNSQ